MAFLKPIIGIGQKMSNMMIYGNNSYVTDADITTGFNISISFYSLTGEYVGSVNTTPDSVGWIDFSIKQKRIGGLDNFEFSISKNLDIPFYNQMEVRFLFAGNHWFTGELTYKPELDSRDTKYKFQGVGYSSYLKKIKITQTYQNKSFIFILQDLIENYIFGYTPILYNLELLNVPNIIISYFEIKNKSLDKVMQMLLKIANVNYKTLQYEYGVDKNRQFYFRPISNDIYRGFFEGFQFQDPEVKSNVKDVINRVDIYRAVLGSNELEYVSTVQNTESQEKLGLANRDLEIPDFMDQITAEKIANAIIERLDEVKETVKLKILDTEDEPYPIGFYAINSKIDNYNKVVNNFDKLAEWTRHGNNTTISIDETKVLSGRRSMKITTGAVSQGEYIEYTLSESYQYPNLLRLYLAQYDTGQSLRIIAYDDNNNYVVSNVNFTITEDYWRHIFDISSLDNLSKVRIEFLDNNTHTIYLDNLDVTTFSWSQKVLVLNDITYTLDRNKLICAPQFGEDIFDYISEIKKIKDSSDNIFEIIKRV